ncbi:MAG TPA: type VI secretion system accessory protein TagJ [Bryobacteraceae bacterium]|nr:type VI secretion system accessory protein TagJ [Bryobacteraceae bacterium]
MSAKELFQAGKLNEAVAALSAEVRDNPTEVRRRTFLFELLCFQGEYDRAEKHLHVLAGANPDSQMGAVLYFSALHAERVRHDLFAKKEYPSAPVSDEPRGGTIDGRPFEAIEDADPRIGPRLELFAAGAYLWIPFEHIESIELQQPRRLRDLLWIPALVRTGPAFRGTELGEILLPALAPFSSRHASDAVRLGRATEWEEADGQTVPFGQRLFTIDGEDVPILEIRKVEFASTAGSAAPSGM